MKQETANQFGSPFGFWMPPGCPAKSAAWQNCFATAPVFVTLSAMRIFNWLLLAALAFTAPAAETHFNFSDWPAGATPTNFQAVLAGDGAPGAWQIVMD